MPKIMGIKVENSLMSKSASAYRESRTPEPLATDFSPSGTLGLRLEDMGPDLRCPFFSDAMEVLGQIHCFVADIEDEQLVVVLVNDFAAEGNQSGAFGFVEFAQEDAELDMLAAVLECLEELGAALVIRHIVGAEVKAAVMV